MPTTVTHSKPARPEARSSRRRDTREALNMRIRPEVRQLIDYAAELAGKNRTDFVLEAARSAAQNTLLEQTVLSLGTPSYAAFAALLDAPPKPNKQLRKTMQTKPVWV